MAATFPVATKSFFSFADQKEKPCTAAPICNIIQFFKGSPYKWRFSTDHTAFSFPPSHHLLTLLKENGDFRSMEQPGKSWKWKTKTKPIVTRKTGKNWANSIFDELFERINREDCMGALQVFEILRHKWFYYPAESLYIKMIDLLGRCGKPHDAIRLFQMMQEESRGPTYDLYKTLLVSLCRNSMIHEAISVIYLMKKNPSCLPDDSVYQIVLKTCVCTSQFGFMEPLFRDLRGCPYVTPTIEIHNLILYGYFKAGEFDRIESMLGCMISGANPKPNSQTLHIVLTGYHEGDVDVMEKWYETFRALRIGVDGWACGMMIRAYVNNQKYDKVLDVMRSMRDLRIPWTVFTFNTVMEAFSTMGDVESMERVFKGLFAERLKANAETLNCLMKGYANAGLAHKVARVVKLAEKLHLRVNHSLCEQGASSYGNMGDLKKIGCVSNLEGKTTRGWSEDSPCSHK